MLSGDHYPGFRQRKRPGLSEPIFGSFEGLTPLLPGTLFSVCSETAWEKGLGQIPGRALGQPYRHHSLLYLLSVSGMQEQGAAPVCADRNQLSVSSSQEGIEELKSVGAVGVALELRPRRKWGCVGLGRGVENQVQARDCLPAEPGLGPPERRVDLLPDVGAHRSSLRTGFHPCHHLPQPHGAPCPAHKP